MRPLHKAGRIVGIDPGSRIAGYGIIDCEGNRLRHVASGCIALPDADHAARLQHLFSTLGGLLDQHAPEEAAVERVFMHRNADSALKLGQARGAAIVACTVRGVGVHEYSANQVKQALVGRGHAAKQQIQHMVTVLLKLPAAPAADAADALAVAVCHAHTRTSLEKIPGVHGARAGRMK